MLLEWIYSGRSGTVGLKCNKHNACFSTKLGMDICILSGLPNPGNHHFQEVNPLFKSHHFSGTQMFRIHLKLASQHRGYLTWDADFKWVDPRHHQGSSQLRTTRNRGMQTFRFIHLAWPPRTISVIDHRFMIYRVCNKYINIYIYICTYISNIINIIFYK